MFIRGCGQHQRPVLFEAVHQRSLRLHSAPAFTACPRHACAMAAWLRPSLSGRRADNATPALRSHGLAEAVLQRPLSPARLCRATPALSPHASAEASDRVCRADDATRAHCPHGLAKAAYLTAAAAGTPALCPHGLGCVAATAARTRAEHTAEYRAAAAVGGFPVHTM